MKIFLTGYRGYIGSHLDWALSLKYGSENVCRFYGNRYNLESWTRELGDFKRGFPDIEAVIHCGAISDMNVDSNQAYVWNYRATQILADNFAGVPFYFLSSAAAMEPVLNYYGWSKASASDWLLGHHSQACVFVPFYVYGFEAGRYKNHFSTPAKILRRELEMIYDPWLRDYIHVSDVVEITLQAVEDRATGKYDLGTGRGQQVRALCELVGQEIPVIEVGHPSYPKHGEIPRIAREPNQYGNKNDYINVKSWMTGKDLE